MSVGSIVTDTLSRPHLIIHHVYHLVRDPVTVKLPPEKWWQSNLASAIAGAVVGALVVIISQVVGETTTARRRKAEVRRRLVNEMAVLVSQCGAAAKDIGTHLHGASAALAPIELGLAAFTTLREDLGVFRDPTLSWRIHGWYGGIHLAVAAGHEQIDNAVRAIDQRVQLAPEADDAMRNVARLFQRSVTRGRRTVEVVIRADRLAFRPWPRRFLRTLRRLRYRLPTPWGRWISRQSS
jgi:hypothetical protein